MAAWMPRLPIIAAVVACAAIVSLAAAPANAADIAWKTGAEFQQQLDAEAGFRWSGQPLREALTTIASTYQIAIFLDRRVDPDQTIEFTAQGRPLREALDLLSQRLGLGVSYVGPVVYFGPKTLTDKLATLAAVKNDEVRNMPTADARRLADLQAWSWPMLSTPKDLVSELAAAEKVRIDGVENIPHDLWPAVALPPLSFADRLTLVLAGFDATFEVAAGEPAVRLVAMPAQVVWEKEYRAPGNTVDWPAELGKRYPEAKIAQQGRRILVAASWEDHQEIARLIRGEKVTRRTVIDVGREKRYSLTVEDQPLGPVARQLAQSLQLQIEFAPNLDDEALGRLISFNVKEATRDELLQAMFAPAGLSYKIDGQVLRVAPRE